MKIKTLKTRPQFKETLSEGTKSVCKTFVLFSLSHAEAKFGYIASKKHFKKAVERNRAKRRLKAALFNVLKKDFQSKNSLSDLNLKDQKIQIASRNNNYTYSKTSLIDIPINKEELNNKPNDCWKNIGYSVFVLRKSILTEKFKNIENELSVNLL